MMKTKTIALLFLVVLVAATTSVEAGGYDPVITCESKGGRCTHYHNPCVKRDYTLRCNLPGTSCCIKTSHYG